MTHPNSIIDDVISFLRQQKKEGREEVYLPSSVWRKLNQDTTPSAAFRPPVAEVARDQPSSGEDADDEKNAAEENFEAPVDWESLCATVEQCTRCGLHRLRTQALFEKGSRQAELMLIGEAPPPNAEIEEMLDKMVAAMRFKQDEVYFANLVKCRTPGGRRPELEERKVCSAYLERQIELVKPKVILLMGEMTLRFLTGRQSITRWHGQWLDCHGVDAMAIYSPLFMFDHRNAKKEAWADLRKLMQKCGRTMRGMD